MQMQKISHRDGKYCIGLQPIGIPMRYQNGTIAIRCGKKEIIATRGYKDENGNFIAFCTSQECDRCTKKGDADCRERHKYRKEEGYYINTEDLLLQWNFSKSERIKCAIGANPFGIFFAPEISIQRGLYIFAK